MMGKYQKFEIKMMLENDAFRLWKNGQDDVICFLETYKDKRSIFFSVRNLLPSNSLKTENGAIYRVLLLGADDGQVIHQDFGNFHVNQSGEGSCFYKFHGPALSCYTHCLFLAEKDDGTTDVIYQGETPFFVKPVPKNAWKECFDWCQHQSPSKVFSPECDETEAVWYKVADDIALPEPLGPAKPLIEKYRHYILGRRDDVWYVGIPGRFLQKEQPCRDEQLFLLWQPLRGGELFFDQPASMTERQQEEIFGYWIAQVDIEAGRLKSV